MEASKVKSTSNMTERWSLVGTTALVTGGTKGIGHAIVEELALFGAAVHTCCRNEAQLQECSRQWKMSSFNVTGSVCDVASRVDREKLIERVSYIFHGKLNVLVNNAGTCIAKPSIELTSVDYSFVMATNLESAFHLSQLSHPLLKGSGRGSIVNISSIAGVVSLPRVAIYAASKGAMNQLTKNLACEWAKDNIRTNCVAPGTTRTPLTESHLGDEDFKRLSSSIPLGRIGELEEVASTVTFLCLPAASYINGSHLHRRRSNSEWLS